MKTVTMDLNHLGMYAASKVFGLNYLYPSEPNNRLYSFDGQVIYDFKRRSFARVFPMGVSKFKIFDYNNGSYLVVLRYKNNLGFYND